MIPRRHIFGVLRECGSAQNACQGTAVISSFRHKRELDAIIVVASTYHKKTSLYVLRTAVVSERALDEGLLRSQLL